MSVQQRNNVNVRGGGSTTLVFTHGFGCNQNMWRFLVPAFAPDYRIVAYDLVGAGLSDAGAYDCGKYGTLHGYASDLLEILDEYAEDRAILVGHSVGAMVGALADLQAPGRVAAHVMIGASPCYLNHPDYTGGFEPADIDSLLAALDSNYLGWASTAAPALMGSPDSPWLGDELATSFGRTDPDIARHFARVAFTADHRAVLARLITPTLVLQCSEDTIVPQAVGQYLATLLPNAVMKVIDNVGHLPHVSAPGSCLAAMKDYLPNLLRSAHAG